MDGLGRLFVSRRLGALLALALLAGCTPAATAPRPPAQAAAPALVPSAAATTLNATPLAPAAAGPAILSFSVQLEDAPAGKRLTFQWETSGATSVRIVSGSAERLTPEWAVAASGTQTVEWADTYYAYPRMTLIAADGAGHEVRESITADWPCRYSYFFSPPPAACPLYEPTRTQAAEQLFEHGRMIWLAETRRPDSTSGPQVLVLYDDGACHQYDDTWAEGEPETDPAIVPPAGMLQPARGLGKVWRERPGLRERLGWATAPAQGYEGAWQPQMRESLPGMFYVRTLDGRVLEVWSTGATSGGWTYAAN